MSHYWDRVAAQFSSWGSRCYICQRTFPSSNQLIRHMGNFHSYVDQCLVEDGLHLVSMETTIKLLSLECGLCGDVKATSADVKNHLSSVHYNKELDREFPGDDVGYKKWRCGRCSKNFTSSSARIRHLGSFHDQVLKYVKEFITVDDLDSHYIPENDFIDGETIVSEPFEDHNLTLLAKWKPLLVSKSSLIPASEEEFLKTPSRANKPKQLGTSSSSTSSKKLEVPENEFHSCPLANCSRQLKSRRMMLVHLAMTHYLEEFEDMFGTGKLLWSSFSF